MTALESVDRLRAIGGTVYLTGDRLRYRIPTDHPEADRLLAEIRRNRELVIAALRELESLPPSLGELARLLPPGVRVVRYEPKTAPFAVAPVSVVTHAGKFFRSYLTNLRSRLAHPASYAAPPLVDILSKLCEAGLELRIDG